MAGSQDNRPIELRHLTALPDLGEAVRLQKEIWGFEDIELLPQRLFVVATKVGGQVIGAFDGDRMIAFLLAIPGLKRGDSTYLHSHMMGVLEPYRNLGVGRMLKLKQREEAQARGIGLVEWTFDPLEIKNAYFNMERLGAVVRRFVLNQYGTTTSHLHGGLPTDRCVAEWYIDSDRVNRIVTGQPYEKPPVLERIPVPADIAEIRATDSRRAREIQAGVSEHFLEYFNRGLAVIGFEKTPEFGTYLLGPWDSK
ncbi:GNAT family N-acetyltransferase [Paludibaculum fermentans]|uniref:GNAT family N-acetyltransferase n=1 Tax=Paludibaculum fermentans TaxID=1473598 RepID=UPI003EB98FD7